MVDIQSLENCHPNLGMIVLPAPSKAAAAAAAGQLHHASCTDAPIDPNPNHSNSVSAVPRSQQERPMRRICGTRVQSLVQAFESMISLADVGSHCQQQLRRISGHKWQPPKLCRIDEEVDLSPHDFQDNASAEDSYSVHSQDLEPCWQDLIPGENEEPHKDEEEFSTCGSYDELLKDQVTCLQPFRLRTQARGARKELEFRKKLEKMLDEDNKLRIPLAQGLPWTTDEPEVVPKPPARENTVPVDVRLCTEFRSVRRAQFDEYIAAKIMYIEQERQERQRLQELAEQEEIKRLRKEMIPRAQLMPYFDRPFIPQRSSKRLTVPKEPSFHCSHDHKRAKCCLVSQ